jgi:hypothetical protein
MIMIPLVPRSALRWFLPCLHLKTLGWPEKDYDGKTLQLIFADKKAP